MLTLNPDVLERLSADIGAQALQQALGLFVAELEAMGNALNEQPEDLQLVARQTHVLKSSAATFGADTLQALAGRIEAQARAGQQPAGDDWQRLRKAVSDTVYAAQSSSRLSGEVGQAR